MFKTIIKEAGIIILILVAIVLILGIVFYDYIPNNKTVPASVEAYAFPEDIKEELNSKFRGEQNIVRTYYIDSSDLSIYETTKEYDKGKVNPFIDKNATVITGNTTKNTNSNGGSSSTKTTNTSSNTNNTSQKNTANTASGEFFNKAGKY